MSNSSRKFANSSKLISLAVIVIILVATHSVAFSSEFRGSGIADENEAVGFVAPQVNAPLVDETVSEILHVNPAHASASDSNPGTAEKPLLTLKRGLDLAMERNKQKISVKVLVYPGTYREKVGYRGETKATVVIEAKEPGKAIVSGSNVWTGWTDQGDNTYTNRWTFNWGVSPLPSGWESAPAIPKLVRRREMIFVDGQVLRPVKKPGKLTDNTFHIDEQNNRVTIKLSAPLGNRLVEISRRPTLLNINNSRNVVVRGLVFQHAASHFTDAAVWVGHSRKVLLENNTFQWNSGGGLGIGYTTNMITRGNRYIYNGTTGFGGSRNVNLLVENDIANNNLWRGLVTNWVDNWSIAGIKHLRGHGVTYRNVETCYNHSHGFWLDSDHRNVVIENLKTCNNASTGMFIEANWGPIVVRNSIIANNKAEGVRGANSERVKLAQNIFYNNAVAQILFTGNSDGREVQDWQTGEKRLILPALNWQIKHNIMIAKDSSQYVYRFFHAKKAFNRFKKTLTADNNVFYHRQSGMPFKLITGVSLDLDNWRIRTNTDAASTWKDVCFKNPDANDFTLTCGAGTLDSTPLSLPAAPTE